MKLQLFIIFCAVNFIFGGISPVVRLAPRRENATDYQAPFQCSVQFKPAENFHFCGCAIISDQWVLVAAHCLWVFLHRTTIFKTILVGTTDLNSGEVRYEPREFKKHEEFGNPEHAFDIGLIRVDKIEFNEKVQLIKIASNPVELDAEAQAFGWGIWRYYVSFVYKKT